MNVRNDIRNDGESLQHIAPSQTSSTQVSSNAIAATAQVASTGKAQMDNLAQDSTQFSAAANEAAQAASESDVRMDKVASIQNALQAGTYNIPATDVAQKVIDSLLVPEK
ncbi:flagellar biosynthesis anti-sigma factor FlgM [Acidicapsa ligni]|uniref:flagellar biosynthesis anti-sigma factor FlgM n=1 Tax=Acidicapsa ligni TaxID=542300 RepID=UPI0021E09C81|nr:flagellar biosynthesis anti-sigma factor FlgM [Acidicapsa ligni]